MAKKVQLNCFKRFIGLLAIIAIVLQSVGCFGADAEQGSAKPT